MKYILLIPLTAITLISVPAVYASQVSLAGAIRECSMIKNDAKRLTCFDVISSSVDATPSSYVEAPVPLNPTIEEKKDAFGAQAIRAREKSRDSVEGAESRELKEMTFKLLEAGKNRAGKLFFIMENGQVWRQLPADTGSVRIPRKLDNIEVTIKRKLLGSHMLILNGRSIKVKRLK